MPEGYCVKCKAKKEIVDAVEEVMKNGADHVIKEHGMKPEDITPEFKEKVKSLIHDS